MSSSAGAQTPQPAMGSGFGGGLGDILTLFGGPRAMRNAQAHQMRMELLRQQLGERQRAQQEELAGKQTFGRTMLSPESGGGQPGPSSLSPSATPGALSPVPEAKQKGLPLGNAPAGGQSEGPEYGVKSFVRRMKAANPDIAKHPEAVANAMQLALPFMNREEASYWRRIADQRAQQRIEQGQQRIGVSTTREQRLGQGQEFRQELQTGKFGLDQQKQSERERHNQATEGATQQRIEMSRERFKAATERHQKTFEQAAERITNARDASSRRDALAALRIQQSKINADIANTAKLMQAGASEEERKSIMDAAKAQQDAIDATVNEILTRAQRPAMQAPTNPPPPEPAQSQSAVPTAPSAPQGFTPPTETEQTMRQARAALQAGADRKAVEDLLRKKGIDPSGL